MHEKESQGKTTVVGLQFNILDHGLLRVVDVMGNDSSIVQAARVSYGDGTKTINEDKGLINYLMKHRHTSPFEMCEIKLHIKLPIFIARQWIRHRTANVNECSARYSILPEEYYIPEIENIAPQSSKNKQCRGGEISNDEAKNAQKLMEESSKKAYQNYITLLGSEDETGIAREIARGVLPLNMYTEWYWKVDLHNLLHFIKLRIHPHAQYEIRVYAEKLAEIVKQWCPIAYSAFEEHVLNAHTFSRKQIEVLKKLLSGVEIQGEGLSKRELEEMRGVLGGE
jgi:thymidylate synthase (FAD)